MAKVFLTGGSGFVGLNVADALAGSGYDVQAYVRPTSSVKYLEQLPVRIIRGELGDQQTLLSAMEGCDYVVHAAGNTSCRRADFPLLWKSNVESTEQVIDAAIECKVKRLVYTSTISTIGARDDRNAIADESEPLMGFRARSPYARTKGEAEKRVIAALDRGLETIILNPCAVVGPYDHTLQWGRLILAVHKGKVPFKLPGGGSFCSARNVARAHVNALTMGQPGERYILSDVHCDYSEFAQSVARKLGITISIPPKNYLLLMLLAYIVENTSWIFGRKPFVDSFRMRIFLGHYYFGSEKAQKELRYQTGSLDEMVGESINWYRANGFMD